MSAMSLNTSLVGILLALAATFSGAPPDETALAIAPDERGTIIVRPPPARSERHRELRDFTRQIIRPPRMHHPVAKFFFPVCPQVLGLAPPDAEAIAERIRENARTLGVGADPDPACRPTIKVAFISPRAGSPESWLGIDSPQLAHLAIYERRRVLTETGPVRAWNRVEVRDYYGQPLVIGEGTLIDPISTIDPMMTTEITGAAIMIAREAAEGFTLTQLADYATIRTLIGSGSPASDSPVPARTILTLFEDTNPPPGLTSFDRALIAELYNASRNSTARRVFDDIARAATSSEIAANAPSVEMINRDGT